MPGLTPDEFRGVAATHLAGLELLSLINEAELPTDTDGAITARVSDSLRTMFVVAERMAPTPTAREKCKKMLGLWAVETKE